MVIISFWKIFWSANKASNWWLGSGKTYQAGAVYFPLGKWKPLGRGSKGWDGRGNKAKPSHMQLGKGSKGPPSTGLRGLGCGKERPVGIAFYMAVWTSCVWGEAVMQKLRENAKQANGILTNQPKVRLSSFVFCFPAFLAKTTCCWVRRTMPHYKQGKVKGQGQGQGECMGKGRAV